MTLLTAMPSAFPLGDDALLVDVGSGVGKLLLATVLMSPAKVCPFYPLIVRRRAYKGMGLGLV